MAAIFGHAKIKNSQSAEIDIKKPKINNGKCENPSNDQSGGPSDEKKPIQEDGLKSQKNLNDLEGGLEELLQPQRAFSA